MTTHRIAPLALFLFACAAPEEPQVGEQSQAMLAYRAHLGAVDYSNSTTGMYYGLGQILTGTTNLYMIFYGPEWTVDKIDIVLDFGHGLEGSPLANVLSTYYDGANNYASSALHLADYSTVTTRTHTLPGHRLSQSSYAAIVNDEIDAGHLPHDPDGIYLVFTDSGAGTEDTAGQQCQCGYHIHPGDLKIAAIDSPAWCDTLPVASSICEFKAGTAPNGDANIDEAVNTAWHEISEAVTDPTDSGWRTVYVTSTSGETEVADMCGDEVIFPGLNNTPAQDLDSAYSVNGGFQNANVHLGGRDFLLQSIWQNAERGGCVARLAYSKPNWSGSYPEGDIDGNGVADLMWRSSVDGTLTAWTYDVFGNYVSGAVVRSALPESWQIYGFGRFNGGGSSDIVIRNVRTGEIHLWLMNGTSIDTIINLTTPPNDELIQAIGDFNGDGYADILFQSMIDNSLRLWTNDAVSNGGTPRSFTFTSSFPAVVSGAPKSTDDSESLGTGNFEGGTKSDVLLYDLVDKNYRYWSFSGNSVSGHAIDTASFGCMRVMGIADMNLDGTADLLCDEGGLPDRFGWLELAHGAPVRLHDLAAMPAHEWRLSGASRMNAYTRATGLLWRNRKTGDLSRWTIAPDGLSVAGTTHLENGLVQSWELVSF